MVDPTLAPLTVGGISTDSTTTTASDWWDLSYYSFLTSTSYYFDPTIGHYVLVQAAPAGTN